MDTVTILDLWLPILLSAVVVFIASFLAHMVLPHHKKDFVKLPDEDGFLAALRSGSVKAGQYMFPCCQDSAQWKDPEFKKRFEAGPLGIMTVWPGPPSMGRNLVLTSLFYVLVGIFVGYLGSRSLGPNPEYLEVFQIVGTGAVLAYCFGSLPHAIWFGRAPRTVAMDLADGVVYALLTAGIFGWLWPSAGLPPNPIVN